MFVVDRSLAVTSSLVDYIRAFFLRKPFDIGRVFPRVNTKRFEIPIIMQLIKAHGRHFFSALTRLPAAFPPMSFTRRQTGFLCKRVSFCCVRVFWVFVERPLTLTSSLIDYITSFFVRKPFDIGLVFTRVLKH